MLQQQGQGSRQQGAPGEPGLQGEEVQGRELYPVSLVWQPPFTMLVDLVGHGDLQVWLASATNPRSLARQLLVDELANADRMPRREQLVG